MVQIKSICRSQNKFTPEKEICLGRLENIVGKGEKASKPLSYWVLNPLPNNFYLLTPLGNKPFENTVGKGEITRNKQFLLFPQCFLPV